RGVYLPPSAFEAWFVSLAHTDAEVELVLAAATEAAEAPPAHPANRWPTCTCPWGLSSEKYGRRPISNGEPISEGRSGPWSPSSHTTRVRAGGLGREPPRPATRA